MQNMHHDALTSEFVIGDKSFHFARGERFQKFVFFLKFHGSMVFPNRLSPESLHKRKSGRWRLAGKQHSITQDYTALSSPHRQECSWVSHCQTLRIHWNAQCMQESEGRSPIIGARILWQG